MVSEKQPDLKILFETFLKCFLLSTAAKLERVATKIFLKEVDQESCG